EPHVASRRGDWLGPGQRPVGRPRDVHEQVERRRGGRDPDAQVGEGGGEIVTAVVVMAPDSEQGGGGGSAGGHQRVVGPARGILIRLRIGRRWLLRKVSPTEARSLRNQARLHSIDIHSVTSLAANAQVATTCAPR